MWQNCKRSNNNTVTTWGSTVHDAAQSTRHRHIQAARLSHAKTEAPFLGRGRFLKALPLKSISLWRGLGATTRVHHPCRGGKNALKKRSPITDELTTGLRLSDQFKLIGVGHLVSTCSSSRDRDGEPSSHTEPPPKNGTLKSAWQQGAPVIMFRKWCVQHDGKLTFRANERPRSSPCALREASKRNLFRLSSVAFEKPR